MVVRRPFFAGECPESVLVVRAVVGVVGDVGAKQRRAMWLLVEYSDRFPVQETLPHIRRGKINRNALVPLLVQPFDGGGYVDEVAEGEVRML